MMTEEEKDIQGQGGQTATGTVRDAGKTLVRNNPLDETTPPPSERNDTAAATATAQQGGDAASGKSERRKELERETGVELATYGDGGQEGDDGTQPAVTNEYVKSSKSVSKRNYEYTPEEAQAKAFNAANEFDRTLRDKGLTLGEIIMKHYPKPAYQEDEEKALKRRRTAALLSDSFKLVSDIAAGAYGGNIYQRDNSKAYSDIDNKLQKLKDDYKRDYDKWLQAMLKAREGDRNAYLESWRNAYDNLLSRYSDTAESYTNRDMYEFQKKMQERGMQLREGELEERKRSNRAMEGAARAKATGKGEDDDYVDVHTPFGFSVRLSKKDREYDQWVNRTVEKLSKTMQGRKEVLRILYPYIPASDYELLQDEVEDTDFGKLASRVVKDNDLYRVTDALADTNAEAMIDLFYTGRYDMQTDPQQLKREFNKYYKRAVFPEVLNYDVTRVFELGDGIAVDENGNVIGRFDEYLNIVPLNETQMDFSTLQPENKGSKHAGNNINQEEIETGIDFSKIY